MFLGGARSIITITNPNVVRERRLVIFRDSFGSSIQGALRATKEFDKVQTELARRKRISRQYSGKSIFLPASSAGTVAPTSAQNSGTRPQNTAGSSGNATANSRVVKRSLLIDNSLITLYNRYMPETKG